MKLICDVFEMMYSLMMGPHNATNKLVGPIESAERMTIKEDVRIDI